MSNGPYDEKAIKNFKLGSYFGRYGALSFVLHLFKYANTEVPIETKELIEKELKKWEWLWCESNKIGEPIPVEMWDKVNE